ncbi:MAG: helix-turn-helix domain-containing protein [Acidobacteriia bacterium]|nr:helix-turn-helix domain-containing protein [Terriglobia bacterium]
MTSQDLKRARLERKWTQQDAARHLGVSQGYLSLLEKGRRAVSGKLVRRILREYEVPPTALPLRSPESWARGANVEAWAHCLGALGYPGFSYVKARPDRNPAEVLLNALMQPDLDSRVAAGLPWLAFHYADMNWDWLVRNAKLYDLQNRLGFVVTLARQVAERTNTASKPSQLAECETLLDRSRLAREDTFCHDSLTEAEKRWLRETRPPEAQHWNLLTDLTAEQLAYAD